MAAYVGRSANEIVSGGPAPVGVRGSELQLGAGTARLGNQVVELEDGSCLAQSNAIIRYLARGTALLPDDPWIQAKVDEWLFWEQYSHEPYVAVARFHVRYLGKSPADLEPRIVECGKGAGR